MIRTLTEWEFVDRMLKESFSYEGSAALFNYLEELNYNFISISKTKYVDNKLLLMDVYFKKKKW